MTRNKRNTCSKGKKWEDPIVAELHEIRYAHARKFKHDLNAIFMDFREYEKTLKEKANKRSSDRKIFK